MRFNIDLSEIENINVLKDRGFEFFGESYGPSFEGEDSFDNLRFGVKNPDFEVGVYYYDSFKSLHLEIENRIEQHLLNKDYDPEGLEHPYIVEEGGDKRIVASRPLSEWGVEEGDIGGKVEDNAIIHNSSWVDYTSSVKGNGNEGIIHSYIGEDSHVTKSYVVASTIARSEVAYSSLSAVDVVDSTVLESDLGAENDLDYKKLVDGSVVIESMVDGDYNLQRSAVIEYDGRDLRIEGVKKLPAFEGDYNWGNGLVGDLKEIVRNGSRQEVEEVVERVVGEFKESSMPSSITLGRDLLNGDFPHLQQMVDDPEGRGGLRIQAVQDIPEFGVKKGDLGGKVEESVRVSANSWISYDSVVEGNSVLNNSLVDAFSQLKSVNLEGAEVRVSEMVNSAVKGSEVYGSNVYGGWIDNSLVVDSRGDMFTIEDSVVNDVRIGGNGDPIIIKESNVMFSRESASIHNKFIYEGEWLDEELKKEDIMRVKNRIQKEDKVDLLALVEIERDNPRLGRPEYVGNGNGFEDMSNLLGDGTRLLISKEVEELMETKKELMKSGSLDGEKFGNFSVVGDSVVHHPLTNKEVLVYQLEDGNGAKVFVQNPAEAVNSETKVQGNGVVFDGVKIDGEVRFLNQDRPILLAGDISVDGKAEVGRDVVINESMKLILEGERIINFDRDVDVFYSKNGFTISNAQEVPEFGIDSSAVELRGLENLSKGDSVVEGKLVSVKADIENISSMANYLAPILKEELSQARSMSFDDIYDGVRAVPGGTAVLKEVAKEIKDIYKPQLEVKEIVEKKNSAERKGGVSL